MRRFAVCFVCLGVLAGAQSSPAVNELTSTLMMLRDAHPSRDAINRRFVAGVMATVEKPNRPFQSEVEDFTSELTAALIGRRFSSSDLVPLTSAIVDVMHSAGVGTVAFHGSVERFEKGLLALQMDAPRARSIANRLEELGKEVRGPEDMPVRLELK
jgi:hypothetical protein